MGLTLTAYSLGVPTLSDYCLTLSAYCPTFSDLFRLEYQPPATDSRISTDPTVKITTPTISEWPYVHIPWSKRAYKECPTIGFDTAETMVLQDYPLWQADIISDLSAHFLNTLCDIDRVRCKRLCIKFPSIWSDTAETIVLHHYPL